MPVRFKDINRLKVKEWKKIQHVNSNHNRDRVAILKHQRKKTLKQKLLLEIKTIDKESIFIKW